MNSLFKYLVRVELNKPIYCDEILLHERVCSRLLNWLYGERFKEYKELELYKAKAEFLHKEKTKLLKKIDDLILLHSEFAGEDVRYPSQKKRGNR
jgi:hypothetical protein